MREQLGLAEEWKTPFVLLVEEHAGTYLPLPIELAAGVPFLTREMSRAINVLVISSPCAFVLSSPATMSAALAETSSSGILVENSRLSRGASIDDGLEVREVPGRGLVARLGRFDE